MSAPKPRRRHHAPGPNEIARRHQSAHGVRYGIRWSDSGEDVKKQDIRVDLRKRREFDVYLITHKGELTHGEYFRALAANQ